MNMVPVESTSIAAVGYDRAKLRLAVRFNSGATYTYSGVQPDVHAALMAAQSIGRFFQDNIRGVFETKHNENEEGAAS